MSGKRALIRGTAILTITSFVTRFMGFFYRIFLGHTFGEENVGLYQLVFPVPEPNLLFPAALHRKMLQAIRKKQKNY